MSMLPCATCVKLFARWYDTTEYYVSLLEQQNRMLLQRKRVPAGELGGAITKARATKGRAVAELRTHQALHGV